MQNHRLAPYVLNRSVKASAKPAKSQETFTLARDKILSIVKRIPFGRVTSYKTVADLAGLAGRARLVGKALHQSGDAPWWRVVRADGSTAIPDQLQKLEQEGVKVKARVDLRAFGWPSGDELLVLNVQCHTQPDAQCDGQCDV